MAWATRPALQPADAHRQEQHRQAGAEVGLLDQRQQRRGGFPGRQGRRDLHHRAQHDRRRRRASPASSSGASRTTIRRRRLRVVCCGIVNRGVAIYNGMIIRLLLDNQIIAMDAKTGKEIWQVKSPEPATIENGYAMTACAAHRQRRHHRRCGRRGIQHSRLPRRIRCSHRQASLAPVHGARAGREGHRNLGRRLRAYGRRQQLGDRQLRSGVGSGLLGHRQSRAVEPAGPQRRQPLHQCDLRGPPEDRRARLVLPDDPGGPVRLRRGADAGRRHAQCRGHADQSGHAGQPQRLPLCARCQGRQAHRRQRVRQGQLGRRHRHEDRTPESDRRFSTRRSRARTSRCGRRSPASPTGSYVLQPEDRDALHQHAASRHDL